MKKKNGVSTKLTPLHCQMLVAIATGHSARDVAMHRTTGIPSRLERVLSRLADRGLVDWSGDVDDVFVTDAGIAALPDIDRERITAFRERLTQKGITLP